METTPPHATKDRIVANPYRIRLSDSPDPLARVREALTGDVARKPSPAHTPGVERLRYDASR